jgi:hypothetical protein
MVYLGSWAFVALVNAFTFLLDSCPFLLEAIGVNNLSLLPFQAHLKLSKNKILLVTTTCLPLFEQLVKMGVIQLQKTISKRLHDYSFSNIILNMSFDSHWTCLKSYARPSVETWLYACLVISCFCLPSNVFPSTLQTKLNLPHPLALGLTHCIYAQPLNPIGIHLLCCAHGEKKTTSHDAI